MSEYVIKAPQISVKDSIANSFNIEDNSRYFHRVIGINDTDIDSLYGEINNIYYLAEDFKDNKGFKIITNNQKYNLTEEEKSYLKDCIEKNDFSTILDNIQVLRLFDYKNNAELLEKLVAIIKNNNSEEKTILYYGNINMENALYLYYKSSVGVNIFYYSVDKSFDKIFVSIDKEEQYSTSEIRENTMDNIEFPTEKLINRNTKAYEASKEIENIMYSENSSVLKPFSFDNHKVVNIGLITTYEELRIILKEDARVRPKFSYDDNNIYIPNVVAKVSGVEEDLKKYKETVKEITEIENSTIFDLATKANALRQHGPLSRGTLKSYCTIEENNVYIDIEKFSNSKDFQFSFLKLSAQHLYLDKINTLINSTDIFKFSLNIEEKIEMALTILKISFPNICEMLHSYNYYEKIPKVYIFVDKELKPDKSRTLSILISFMNLLAFDVVLFTPSGYIDIERDIQDDVVKIHKLGAVERGLTYKDIHKKRLFF